MTADDLKECLAIQPARSGSEFVSTSDVLPAWRWMLQQRGFAGVVIGHASANSFAACGASIFVASGWLDRELEDPRPGLNARLIASVTREGGKAVLTYDDLARSNAEGTLDLLILLANWRSDLSAPEEISESQMQMAMSFLELHRGYRLKRMVTEAVDSTDIAHLDSVPGWTTISTFDEWLARNPDTSFNRDRALGLVTYESCMMEPGTVAMSLFRHRRPALGLDDNAQTLLLSALRHVSDQEIAGDLHISESAVRWRWARLFAHVERIRPDLADPHAGSKRGPVKRNRILAYVRENPEELRPWKDPEQQAGPEAARRGRTVR